MRFGVRGCSWEGRSNVRPKFYASWILDVGFSCVKSRRDKAPVENREFRTPEEVLFSSYVLGEQTEVALRWLVFTFFATENCVPPQSMILIVEE